MISACVASSPGEKPNQQLTLFEQWETDLFAPESKTELRVPKGSEHGKKPIPGDVLEELQELQIPQKIQAGGTEYFWVKNIGSGGTGRVELFGSKNGQRQIAVKVALDSESRVVEKIRGAQNDCAQIQMRKIKGARAGAKYYLYAMPYMQGTLVDLLKNQEQMHPRLKAALVEIVRKQVVCLLEITGVPYMDLKLENVLFRSRGGDVCVHVADLGSLKTESEQIICTYPPPESHTEDGIIQLPPTRTERERLLSWSIGILLLLFFDAPLVDKHFLFPQKGDEQTKWAIQKGQEILEENGFDQDVRDMISFEPSRRKPISETTILPPNPKKRKTCGIFGRMLGQCIQNKKKPKNLVKTKKDSDRF